MAALVHLLLLKTEKDENKDTEDDDDENDEEDEEDEDDEEEKAVKVGRSKTEFGQLSEFVHELLQQRWDDEDSKKLELRHAKRWFVKKQLRDVVRIHLTKKKKKDHDAFEQAVWRLLERQRKVEEERQEAERRRLAEQRRREKEQQERQRREGEQRRAERKLGEERRRA